MFAFFDSCIAGIRCFPHCTEGAFLASVYTPEISKVWYRGNNHQYCYWPWISTTDCVASIPTCEFSIFDFFQNLIDLIIFIVRRYYDFNYMIGNLLRPYEELTLRKRIPQDLDPKFLKNKETTNPRKITWSFLEATIIQSNVQELTPCTQICSKHWPQTRHKICTKKI